MNNEQFTEETIKLARKAGEAFLDQMESVHLGAMRKVKEIYRPKENR